MFRNVRLEDERFWTEWKQTLPYFDLLFIFPWIRILIFLGCSKICALCFTFIRFITYLYWIQKIVAAFQLRFQHFFWERDWEKTEVQAAGKGVGMLVNRPWRSVRNRVVLKPIRWKCSLEVNVSPSGAPNQMSSTRKQMKGWDVDW